MSEGINCILCPIRSSLSPIPNGVIQVRAHLLAFIANTMGRVAIGGVTRDIVADPAGATIALGATVAIDTTIQFTTIGVAGPIRPPISGEVPFITTSLHPPGSGVPFPITYMLLGDV